MTDLNSDDLSMLKSKTKLNSNLIIGYFKQFLEKYPKGRIKKQEFIDDIVIKLIIDDTELLLDKKEKYEQQKEKIKLCERLFDICDQDESGAVDFIEYFILFWSRAKGNSFEKLTMMFEMYDLNGSGEIDFNELHSIVKTLLKLKYSEEEINQKSDNEFETIVFQDQTQCNSKLPFSYNIAMYIMRKLDTNRNARLTKDEFVNGCLNNKSICGFLTPLKIF